VISPDEMIEEVMDRDTFLAFVLALAEERRVAERMEREDPVTYQLDGALRWQNGDISAFLEASLCYFESRPFHRPEEVPSWRMFAEFLYFGKIYE
jgi:hypothetical protein